jgi:putative transposase
MAGIGEEKIWKDVKGQSVLGQDEFIEIFLKHVKGSEELKEIPKSQRYIGRPGLAELLKGTKGRKEISRKAKEAVERYGYRQKEVADYPGIHYSTLNGKQDGK